MKTNKQTKSLTIKAQAKVALTETIGACRNLAHCVNQLKLRLVHRLAREFDYSLPGHLLQKAVVEAEAVAWSTPYPHLFLPVLAEEKVLDARQWNERQRRILQREAQLRAFRYR